MQFKHRILNFVFESPCRTCRHRHLWKGELPWIKGRCVEQYFLGAMEARRFTKCKCKRYAPLDNLEYLEFKYMKKIKKLLKRVS
jgi:hypothetical protein